jgi:cytidylate kinase
VRDALNTPFCPIERIVLDTIAALQRGHKRNLAGVPRFNQTCVGGSLIAGCAVGRFQLRSFIRKLEVSIHELGGAMPHGLSSLSGSSGALRAMMESVRARVAPEHTLLYDDAPGAVRRFVTISRQAGAGAKQIGQRLAERMSALGPNDPPWTSWDRDLVEKIAAEHHLSRELIETLSDHNRSWLETWIASVQSSVNRHFPDEFQVYRRVAQTLRAMAQGGYVVLVGRGGMCITRGMPGGLHVRLVAPRADRVRAFAERNSVSMDEADRMVRSIDLGREKFYRHFFPNATFAADEFSVTFNTAELREDQILDAVVAVLSRDTASSKKQQGELTA